LSELEPEFKEAHILLAEDNFINQKIVLAQLSRLHCRADAVANGREVLEVLQRISYNLIFMDCQMPEMDGYDTSQAIRQWEKRLSPPVPVEVAGPHHRPNGSRNAGRTRKVSCDRDG
jgi:CheY-like chemotaxis protein